MDPRKASDLLWRKGVLKHLIYAHQRPLYEFFTERDGKHKKQRVGNISRQFGKDYNGLITANETAIRKPRARVCVAAPTGIMLRRFMLPNMQSILQTCPADLRPSYNGTDHIYTYPNGSTIILGGVDKDGGESFRGPANDLFIISEAGFINGLEHFIKSIILPTFLTTNGRLLVYSTPPETPGHYFVQLIHEAKLNDAYLQLDIDQQTIITPEQRAVWVKECGGEHTSTWRREYKCQIVIDQSKAVVPEFEEMEAQIIKPVAPPDQYVKTQESLDWGYRDAFGGLYSYYDFKRAKLCVQRETLATRKASDQLVEMVRADEEAAWPGRQPELQGDEALAAIAKGLHVGRRPDKRVCDCDEQTQLDLARQHRFHVNMVGAKDSLEAMVNNLRLWIRQAKIEVDPSCVNLIFQLRSALWNNTRTEWIRTEHDNHFDLVAALMYLLRIVPVHVNPYPAVPDGVTPTTHWIDPKLQHPRHPIEALIPRKF